jgi:hypothetical protein
LEVLIQQLIYAIFDQTNGANRVQINTDGHIDLLANVDISNGLDVTGAITGTGDMTIDTNTLHVDSTNNRVGIGTTSPIRQLDINNSSHATLALTSTTQSSLFFADDDTNIGQISYMHGTNYMYFRVNDAERMRIDSSGAVRIGHTDAIGNASADNLVIGTGSGNNGLSIYSGNDSQGRIDFRDTTGTSDGQGIIFYQHTTDSLQIHTNSAERMRIDSSGRLGLGLTPNTSAVATNVSAGLFQTDGNIDIRYAGTNSDPAGARYLNFINTDTTLVNEQPMGGIHWIGNDTSNPNNINCSFTALNSGSGGGSGMFIFKTAGSERFRISPTGNVGINTTSPAHKLDLDNGSARFNRGNSAGEILTLRGLNANQFRFDTDGLKFGSDTAAANALDDYEEGTFSPTFGASNGSSTTTYTTQQGAYTKIGNTVFFNIYIVLNSISTNTHSVIVIGALPFTNTSNRVSIHSIRSSGFQGSGDDSRPFAGTVEANNTKIELVKAANGGTSDFTTSNSQGGTTVYIAGQYPVS